MLEALDAPNPADTNQIFTQSDKRQKTDKAPKTECCYYLLKDCTTANKETLIAYIAISMEADNGTPVEIQKIFVVPSRRRTGIAEAFFSFCMLHLHQQHQQVKCRAPKLAIKVLKALGFTENEEAPKADGASSLVSLSLDLGAFARRLLRP